MLADVTTPFEVRGDDTVFFGPEELDAWTLAATVASDGLWYYDVSTDLISLSPRSLELLGYPWFEPAPGPLEVKRHVFAADLPLLQRAVARILRGERARAELELRVLTVHGGVRWALVRMRSRRDLDGRLTLLAGSLADIDTRKRSELSLREEARRDALTSLPNRTALAERLRARVARAANGSAPGFALLYMDVDRFKLVNDTLGHATGDVVLRETTDRIARVLGPADLLARVGGDEFVILLDTIDDERDAIRITEAMHDAMRELVTMVGRDIFTSLSIGVRLSDDLPGDVNDIIRDADVAMYHAKHQGGARTVVFDHRMHRATTERLRLQTELAFALRRNELRVAYQPIFDLERGRLHGFEALVRWQHPTRGTLSAADFVDAANESGLIVLLGRWMLNEVCAQLAKWRAGYPNAMPLTVAVNLCEREIVDPEFTFSVEAALRAHDLPADFLVLEMSEGAMTANAEYAIPALRRLRELGAQIQMDGFGRGYTSLSVLRRMPLTSIKIDGSYIANVGTDEEARAMVSTISAFARALGLVVVAEGVETQQQADVLAEMGYFRFVQGNHFGRPSAEAVARGLLDER